MKSERDILRTELQWTLAVGAAAGAVSLAILWASLAHLINPPSNFETIDPAALHLSDEFTESNLGTRVEADGEVVTRIVATQFAFAPSCVLVPADRPVTMRLTSPDVIHGVLVTVDPASRAVFAAGPLIVPGNPLPRLPRAKAGR